MIPAAPLMMPAVGKSGPGTCCIQRIDAGFRIIDQCDRRIDDFVEVVRWYVQVAMPTAIPAEPLISRFRHARRQGAGFEFFFVVVGHEIDGFLVDIGQQAFAARRCRRHSVQRIAAASIAINRTKVALTVDQRIATESEKSWAMRTSAS